MKGQVLHTCCAVRVSQTAALPVGRKSMCTFRDPLTIELLILSRIVCVAACPDSNFAMASVQNPSEAAALAAVTTGVEVSGPCPCIVLGRPGFHALMLLVRR